MKKAYILILTGLLFSTSAISGVVSIGVAGSFANYQHVYKVICPTNFAVTGVKASINDLATPNYPKTNISVQVTWQDVAAGPISFDAATYILYPDGVYRWINVKDSDYWSAASYLPKGKYGFYKVYVRKYSDTSVVEKVAVSIECIVGLTSVNPNTATKIANNTKF